MPALIQHPLSRRRFLQGTSLLAAGVILRPAFGADADAREEVRLALFSDTHIPADPAEAYRGFRPVENLERVVPQIVTDQPAAAILCGDAARLRGLLPDYERLKSMLAPLVEACPVAIALGNHDDRTNFRKVFGSAHPGLQPVTGKHVMVLEWPRLRAIVLDSLLFVNETPGLLGKAQRLWLDRFLQDSDDRATVLFAHHPPDDGDGSLLDSDRLLRLIAPHTQVKALVFGHSHVRAHTELEGVQLINLPAVGYNFSDQQPVGWQTARFGKGGVDLTLHAVGGNPADDGKTLSLAWGR